MLSAGLRLRPPGHLSLSERGVEVADGRDISHAYQEYSPNGAYKILQTTGTCVRRTISFTDSGDAYENTRNERKSASNAYRARRSTRIVEEAILHASLALIAIDGSNFPSL